MKWGICQRDNNPTKQLTTIRSSTQQEHPASGGGPQLAPK